MALTDLLTFTNNLDISCVLSGADPFDGVTVSSGATTTSTRSNSTDGSHNVTMTISGSDGGYLSALADVNLRDWKFGLQHNILALFRQRLLVNGIHKFKI